MGSFGVPAVHRLDRWGERVGSVAVVGEFCHSVEVGGADEVTFSTLGDVSKGDRLVWFDGCCGAWREHVVTRTSEGLDGLCKVVATGPEGDLEGCYVEQLYLSGMGAEAAFGAVLAGTGWTLDVADDVVADGGAVTCWVYHTTVLAALRRLAGMFGCELVFAPVVEGGSLVGHVLRVVGRVGSWRGFRVAYGRDLAGCRRAVLEEPVVTALYGYGAGMPVVDDDGAWHGGYSRKLTFGDVNGGVNWVGDEEARERWGRLGAGGVRSHVFGEVVFAGCYDAEELLGLTRRALASRVVPRVSYEVDAVLGDGVGVSLGDDVLVVDPLFAGGRVRERCVRLVRTFCPGMAVRATMVLGFVEPDLAAKVQDVVERVDVVEAAVADVAGEVSVVGGKVFEPEPEPAEAVARALLLEDGTLEFTCLASEESPSGGTVDAAFEACGGYAALSEVPWHGRMKDVVAVRFDGSFAAAGVTDLSYWFYAATGLADVSGMGCLAGVVGFDYVFASCSKLTELDLRRMTFGDGVRAKMAFGACAGLTRILVDAGWEPPAFSDKYATFYNCTSLVGGNGTAYSGSRISGDYMRVDAAGSVGYLTAG